MRTSHLLATAALLVWIGGSVSALSAARIEKLATDYSATTYLTNAILARIQETGRMGGYGEVEYALPIPETGWYELWVEGGGSTAVSLFLDGKLVIYSPFPSGVWPQREKAEKMLNLYLTAGNHALRFSVPGLFGLPNFSRFRLESAADLTGRVRVSLEKDYLVFRKGEAFFVNLAAGRGPEDASLSVKIVSPVSQETLKTLPVRVPAGPGNLNARLRIPTSQEGTFDLQVLDAEGRFVDRVIQYVVIDPATAPVAAPEVKLELVQEINCATQEPDYATNPTRVIHAPCGAYRESGTVGRFDYGGANDLFAYTLTLPTIQDLYMVEVDYPDDDYRTFTIALAEQLVNPYAPTTGVDSGGIYSLSNSLQTSRLYYWPRNTDPRLVFVNWVSGQRAAAAKIRVYRVTSALGVRASGPGERLFGLWQEEPGREYGNFGTMPRGNEWWNLTPAMERLGQLSNLIGANLFEPTLCVYQSMAWPSNELPGFQMVDGGGMTVEGPRSLKDPLRKDLVRMELLMSEKYKLNYVGQLFVTPQRYLYKYLDLRFGGDGKLDAQATGDDTVNVEVATAPFGLKPWLTASKSGRPQGTPYLNPVYPAVQEWATDLVSEVAQRYRDYPAFRGVALRLMGWQFAAWQCFPSLDFGYDDFTVALFSKDTGLTLPVPADVNDPQRFRKRYDWIMANAYDKWVEWRCAKIYSYHSRLAQAVTAARPDLKLYLDAESSSFDGPDIERFDEKGWLGEIRGTGLDPARIARNPALVLKSYNDYPYGSRSFWRGRVSGAENCDMWANPVPLPFSHNAKPAPGGTTNSIYYNASSFEGNFARYDQLGLQAPSRNREAIHGAGVVHAAGRHMLDRFANAFAEGNMTCITDGNHGQNFALTQPQYTAEMWENYRALPAIGMTRYPPSGDPVAVWSGRQAGQLYFYVVNRVDYPVEIQLKLSRATAVTALAEGKRVVLRSGALRLNLDSYQFLAFSCDAAAEFGGLTVTVPDQAKTRLQAQLDFTQRLLTEESGPVLVPLSPVAFAVAGRQYAAARAAFEQGQYWLTRRLLLTHQLVRVYDAFGAYPPDLFYRKTPEVSTQALMPAALAELVTTPDRSRAEVVDGGKLEPSFSGVPLLTWTGDGLSLSLTAPLLNRYRLSCGYLRRPPYARPIVHVDGQEAAGQGGLEEQNAGWGRQMLSQPLVLTPGAHIFTLRNAGGPAALFSLDLTPLYRPLTARHWRVLGPFEGSMRLSLDRVSEKLDQVHPAEEVRDFSASYAGVGGKPVAWRRLSGDSDYVDLGAYHLINYAVAYVDSPDAREGALSLGVDYWAKLWLNGELVFTPDQRPATAPHEGETLLRVPLRAGRNEILLKVHSGSAGNGFWLALSDPGDLRYES